MTNSPQGEYPNTTVDSVQFAYAELLPLTGEMHGPVDTFTLEKDVKQAAREHAIATGDLVGDFAACPAFDDVDQKKIRQESVRARSVLVILQDRDAEGEQTDPEETALVRDVANFQVWQGVVVEASRRSAIAHQTDNVQEAEFCDSLLQEGLEALYGAPKPEVAQAAASEFRPLLDSVLEADDPSLQSLARDFTEKYPFMLTATGEAMQLDPAVETAIRELLVETFTQPFQELREEFGEINEDNVVDITRRLLEKTNFRYQNAEGEWVGWDSRRTDKRNGFYTNSREEMLEVGEFTNPPTWNGFEKLMVHEIGVHAWRTRNGRRLGSELLETALPGAVDFEETLGSLFEKVWSGSEEVGREQYRYLIASYADGVLDGQRHDKNETYQFIVQLKFMELAAKQQSGTAIDADKLTTRARSLLFDNTYRAFRGMPDGIVMPKDTSYYGNKAGLIAHANQHASDPAQVVEDLLIAKINTLNPKQLQYAKQQKARAV